MQNVTRNRTTYRVSEDGTLEQLDCFDATHSYFVGRQEYLGSGASGTVIKCWKLTDTGFAPMAVKLSNGSRANNAMLLTEAAALQQLEGFPGTVQVDNCGEHKGCTFIVMELVPGVTLREVGQQMLGLPNKQVWLCHVALQLLEAVHTMHARGIVWRDGCCNNVMVETDNSGIPQVTVLDFGACERIPADGMLWLHVVGTFAWPEYAAPEIVDLWEARYHAQDFPRVMYSATKADAWAIGAMLFELATGDGFIMRPPGCNPLENSILWRLQVAHAQHINAQGDPAWSSDMRKSLVAGSGSTEYADLVLHLLDYEVITRWTPTEALQAPCVQAINASCGYPSLLVPLPAAVQDSTIPMGLLSSQSHADIGSLDNWGNAGERNLVKSTGLGSASSVHSPRITSHPAGYADPHHAYSSALTERPAAAHPPYDTSVSFQQLYNMDVQNHAVIGSDLQTSSDPQTGQFAVHAHPSTYVNTWDGAAVHSFKDHAAYAVGSMHSGRVDDSAVGSSSAGAWQVPLNQHTVPHQAAYRSSHVVSSVWDTAAAAADGSISSSHAGMPSYSQHSTDHSAAVAMLPAGLLDDDEVGSAAMDGGAATALLPVDLFAASDEEQHATAARLPGGFFDSADPEIELQTAMLPLDLLDTGDADQALLPEQEDSQGDAAAAMLPAGLLEDLEYGDADITQLAQLHHSAAHGGGSTFAPEPEDGLAGELDFTHAQLDGFGSAVGSEAGASELTQQPDEEVAEEAVTEVPLLYGLAGLEPHVDLSDVYSAVNGTFISKMDVGNFGRGFYDTGSELAPCIIRKTALYEYDTDSELDDSSSDAGTGSQHSRDEASVEEVATSGFDHMSQHSHHSGSYEIAGGFEAQGEPSNDPTTGAVEQQNVLSVSAASGGPGAPGVPVHDDDVRRLNSGVSAMRLLEQSCPHLLAGATGYMLTAQHLYRVTRLPSEAVTLHEVMSQHQGALQGFQGLRKGLGQHFVQHVACNLFQALVVLHEQGHFLGAISPHQVLVQPHVCLMDYSSGATRFDAISIERTAVDTLLAMRDGYHAVDICTGPGDMYSMGVLLYQMATGCMPFPLTYHPHSACVVKEGSAAGPLVDEATAHHRAWKAVHWWPHNRICKTLAANVDQPMAALIASLLHPTASRRPSAEEVLHTPCLQHSMQPAADAALLPTAALSLSQVGQVALGSQL